MCRSASVSGSSALLRDMSGYEGDDEDAAFFERWQRWQARYADACIFAPVPMWWPWPLEQVTVHDGDPDTGLVVVDLEPFLWPGETCADAGYPYAKLVRQRAGEPPYSFGWPGFAWMTPEQFAAVHQAEAENGDPEPTPVFAHTWKDGRWQWTVFICGIRQLTNAEVTRIRERLEPTWQFPQGVSSFRPWV